MPETPLPAGTPAPNFTVRSVPHETVSLKDFQGRPVILAFYPGDWTPVCGADGILKALKALPGGTK